MNKAKTLLIITLTALSACSAIEEKATLRSIDVQAEDKKEITSETIKQKSTEDIRNAYTLYLSKSDKSDNSRQTALNRLAELEFEISNQITQQKNNSVDDSDDAINEKLYQDKLNTTINLLNTSLNDYPKAKGNDKVLYQLAKAYDQNGDYDSSIEALSRLINQYPKSPYFVESQFRLAEANFSKGDYSRAENDYTEVLLSPKNIVFYEKSVFKRGWTRFKQAFYQDAIDDYLLALSFHRFDDIDKLSQTEKDQFEEYFRAIGLSFTNLGGGEALNSFFATNTDFKYKYYTYSVVSDLYLKQERYSDAADTLQQFINLNPGSKNKPYAQLNIVKIWQQSQFSEKLYQSIESFYLSYNLKNKYWKTDNKDDKIYKSIAQSIREYVLLMAEYYHSNYQKQANEVNYASATKWYRRYLNDYDSFARKDNMYFKFAELLREKKDYPEALKYYELAAYDDELILDKKSAYATILITDQIYKTANSKDKPGLLAKHIKYSRQFAQLYRDDSRSPQVIAHASELSYMSANYAATIELANLLSDDSTQKINYNVAQLKAQAYFNLKQYADSESIYSSLLRTPELSQVEKKELSDRMALAVYQLASQFKQQNNLLAASQNYMRIASIAPASEIAATGMYDAIAIYMGNQSWPEAINAIENFQSRYPQHQYSKDVTKKLSVAYLNSNQSLKAAEQFEKISSFEGNDEIKMAALWQAAELYESKKNYQSATRSYSEYANNYKKPYPQYMEAMLKLVELYSLSNNKKLLDIWQNRILNADNKSAKQDKTDRTNYIVATTSLAMARQMTAEFERHKLVEPLSSNLRKKKKSMQQAITLYGQASSYGLAEVTTESTYAIAEIYQNFNLSLLSSERPKHLKGEELVQYNILIEDQAFPFEDKAIEFYEINLSRIKDGMYNDWVSKSLTKLKALFPAKYDRKSKIEGHINVEL